MINIKQWMEVTEYRITEGDTYGWNCYGYTAYQLSAWNGIHGKGGWSIDIVFDTKTQTVYEVGVCDYTHDRAYRIINPDYKSAYDAEVSQRGELGNQAWDNVDYTDLETDEDWIEKTRAIVAGEDYDTRVSIPLDFTDEELLKYMKLAHDRDMTFNQFIEEALRSALEDYKRDPEGTKQRAKEWINS
jgi:hypothetical protein